jgi:hypothetical protein
MTRPVTALVLSIAAAFTSADGQVAGSYLGLRPSVSGLTCPPVYVPTQLGSRIGVFRPGTSGTLTQYSFIEDTNGLNMYVPGNSRYIANFFPPSGPVQPMAGDLAVSGDWTGDGHSKIGIFRPSTGQWFLDANNDGVFDAGDLTYNYGGLLSGGVPVDVPVVGDWAGLGKSCVGVFRLGFLWVLDTNCNGQFDAPDNSFGFGGIAGDVPVVGSWTGAGTRVGLVRKYAPGGVPQGPPFFWVLDAAAATDKTQADHLPCVSAACGSAPFGYGGIAGDVFVAGDWLGTGIYRAGVYRQGTWLEDTTGAHTYDTIYQFGGVPTDQPVVGKW